MAATKQTAKQCGAEEMTEREVQNGIYNRLEVLQRDFQTLKEEVKEVKGSVEMLSQKVDLKMEPVLQRVQDHHRTLYTGTEKTDGLTLRIDRMEQVEGRRAKGFWVVLGTAVAAVGGVIVNFFKK